MSKTTYEDMIRARDEFTKSKNAFGEMYYKYLISVLEQAGFNNKLVRVKDSNLMGQFSVEGDSYHYGRPFAIKFFPVTLKGTISLRSKYLNNLCMWKEDTLVEQLQTIAEVVGDLP